MEMKRSSTTFKNEHIDSIAIGGFDGIHLGHQKLISHLGSFGSILVIDRGSALLTPGLNRAKYIDCGVILLPFEDIKLMSGREFISYLKTIFPALKKIVVGYDFRFGYMAKSDVSELREFFDGKIIVVDEVLVDNISVHSKLIKEMLRDGDIVSANRLLGREYEIEGSVVRGQGVGAKELFATINIECNDFLVPKDGVYATFTHIDDHTYMSATFIGDRVSTDGEYSIETHILDNYIDNIPKTISITFIDFIRENREFSDLSDLKREIKRDIEIIEDRLSSL